MRARRTAALFAVATAVGFAAATQSGVAASPHGDRVGIAFFATMHRAYSHTPGVEMTIVSRSSKRSVFGHFLLQLRAGRVVAEEFAGSGADRNRLLARRGRPTYAWQAAGKCWRRVPSADPRTLTEVGLPYPYPRTGVKTMRPRRHRADVILTTEDSDKVWFLATQNVYRRTAKRIVTYTVDARTDRIRSIAIQVIKDGTKDIRPHPHSRPRWWTATIHVTTLQSKPHLPTAMPSCNR
jgi:hypothetical protein